MNGIHRIKVYEHFRLDTDGLVHRHRKGCPDPNLSEMERRSFDVDVVWLEAEQTLVGVGEMPEPDGKRLRIIGGALHATMVTNGELAPHRQRGHLVINQTVTRILRHQSNYVVKHSRVSFRRDSVFAYGPAVFVAGGHEYWQAVRVNTDKDYSAINQIDSLFDGEAFVTTQVSDPIRSSVYVVFNPLPPVTPATDLAAQYALRQKRRDQMFHARMLFG